MIAREKRTCDVFGDYARIGNSHAPVGRYPAVVYRLRAWQRNLSHTDDDNVRDAGSAMPPCTGNAAQPHRAARCLNERARSALSARVMSRPS
jgi:hypothetical protein